MVEMASLLNVNRVHGRLFGIEIETEGRRLPVDAHMLDQIGWIATRDGSLRGEEAIEYVTSAPLSLSKCATALQQLDKAFKTHNSRVDPSIRAAIHIHINISDLTPLEVFNFISAYYLIEDLICRKAGENRQGNLFALRLSDAYGIIPGFIRPALEENNLRVLNTDEIRYAAMNLRSMFRHGTLEFRPIGTKAPFTSTIQPWLVLMHTLMQNTRQHINNPIQLMELFSDRGGHQAATLLLGEAKANEWIFCHDDWEDVMMESARLIQDYIYAPKDWESVFTSKRKKRSYTSDPEPMIIRNVRVEF